MNPLYQRFQKEIGELQGTLTKLKKEQKFFTQRRFMKRNQTNTGRKLKMELEKYRSQLKSNATSDISSQTSLKHVTIIT